MTISTVRWPQGQGRPVLLGGVGEYRPDLTIAPEDFTSWRARIRVEPDGSVMAPGGGDIEQRIGNVNEFRKAMSATGKVEVLPERSIEDRMDRVLRDWARSSGLEIAEEPEAPAPEPLVKRRKREE